jgi:hypothetical protein
MIIFLPFTLIKVQTPSQSYLEKKKCFYSGFIETKNGSQIEINLVWGDLFQTKKIHRDMGFDLVGISCYFDPIDVEGKILSSFSLANWGISPLF